MSLKFASNSGFACSPVSKCLAVLVGGFHVASHVPALHSFFRKIVTGPDRITSLDTFLRYLGAKFLFLDTKSTIFSCVVIYLFRILERRYGSLKFSSNLIFSCLLSMSLEICLEHYFETKNFGPLGLIIPLYVPWFREMALATKASMLSSVCGFISGVLVYCTPLKKFRLPGFIGTIFSKTIGQLVMTYPDKDTGLMGATLDIQRSQQTEALENQLMRARNRFQVPVNGGGRQLRIDEMWGGAAAGAMGGAAAAANHQLPVIQSHVNTLVDMGFTREERAEQALRQARNNIDEATNILLQDMM